MLRRIMLVIAAMVALVAPLNTPVAQAEPAVPTHVSVTVERVPGTDWDYQATVTITADSGTPTGTVEIVNMLSMGEGSFGGPVYPVGPGSTTIVRVFSNINTMPFADPDQQDAWVQARFTGSGGYGNSTGQGFYNYPRTTVVLTPSPLQVYSGLIGHHQLKARATTTDGQPIAGRTIRFLKGKQVPTPSTLASRTVCTGVTNADGYASCGSLTATAVVLSGGGWAVHTAADPYTAAQVALPMK